VAVTRAPSLRAANYPDHSVKIIVLFPPGGSTDIAGRIVAQKLSERFVASFGKTERTPSGECIIKGNVNANGERIYHMPDQEFLGQDQNGCRQGQVLVLHKRGGRSRRVVKSTQVTTICPEVPRAHSRVRARFNCVAEDAGQIGVSISYPDFELTRESRRLLTRYASSWWCRPVWHVERLQVKKIARCGRLRL
jgi:hypothetical protein